MPDGLVATESNKVASKDSPTPDDIKYYRDFVHPLLFQVSTMFIQGKDKNEILKVLGLTATQANKYELWFPDFRNAITQGFISTTVAVENALIKAAKGFEYEEQEFTEDFDRNQNLVRKRKKTVKKYSPPNVKAAELYLLNRDPDNWKKASVENSANNGTQIGQVTINVPDDKIKSMISDMQSNFLQDTNPNVIEAETVDDSDSVFSEEVKENG